VNIGVVIFVDVVNRINYRLRLLRRRSIIQIGQWPTMEFTFKKRKLTSYF